VLLLGGSALPAFAANIAYEGTLGAGHSDNIRRADNNKEDENIASVGVRFSVDERTPRLQADAVGNFSYAEYLEDTFDSELLGNFAGNATFGIVPQRIEWVVSDNYGQVLSDPFTPATPDNRENINYFATGPDLTAAFGSNNRLRLSSRYALTTYEDSPLDSDSKSAELAYLRLLSSASTASLHARAQQIEYDEAGLGADYDQYEAFGRYDVTGARTALTMDLGYTEMDRDSEADSDAGLLLRLEAARRVSASSTATLRAGREFANSGAAFAASQSGAPVGLDSAPGRQTPQPFTNTYVAAGWNFLRGRTGFSVNAGWSDQSYEESIELDQTLTTLTAAYRRDLSARTSITLNAAYISGDFETQGDYDDINGRASFAWQLSRAVSVAATAAHFRRSGDVLAGDYSENQVWLSISYARGEPRTALAGPDFGVDRGR
jgi:hypothetical protein